MADVLDSTLYFYIRRQVLLDGWVESAALDDVDFPDFVRISQGRRVHRPRHVRPRDPLVPGIPMPIATKFLLLNG